MGAWLISTDPVNFWVGTGLAGAAAVAGFILAFVYLYRARLLEDTPTSKIRSAAQGYVELQGRARSMPGTPIYAPLSGVPCCWYTYKIEERMDSEHHRRWHTVESSTSDGLFLLEDDTGTCAIDPDGAAVTPTVRLAWYGDERRPLTGPLPGSDLLGRIVATGDYRYIEARIHDGDALLALGLFRTAGPGADINPAEDMRALLSTWKKDRAQLLARFDANSDGEIDMTEWDTARRAAQEEVSRDTREQLSQPGTHLLAATNDTRRPYLLSTLSEFPLVRRLRWQAAMGFSAFFLLGVGVVWAVGLRLGE